MQKMLRQLLKAKWVVIPIVYIVRAIMACLLATCRLQITGLDNLVSAAKQGGCILILWHNRLSLVAPILSRHAPQFHYVPLVSASRDGQWLAALASSYPQAEVLSIPHVKRSQALRQAIACLKQNSILIITPDGPRGPAYQVKAGAIVAARTSGCPLIPFSWQANRYWSLPSWDTLRIPKPFSRIDIAFGPPILFSEDAVKDRISDKSSVECALKALER